MYPCQYTLEPLRIPIKAAKHDKPLEINGNEIHKIFLIEFFYRTAPGQTTPPPTATKKIREKGHDSAPIYTYATFNHSAHESILVSKQAAIFMAQCRMRQQFLLEKMYLSIRSNGTKAEQIRIEEGERCVRFVRIQIEHEPCHLFVCAVAMPYFKNMDAKLERKCANKYIFHPRMYGVVYHF